MMKDIFLVFTLISFNLPIAGANPFYSPFSAKRKSWINYQEYAEMEGRLIAKEPLATALGAATPYRDDRVYTAIAWNQEELDRRYKQIREARLFSRSVNFVPRRISWLYPDDGCFARAAMANRTFKQWDIEVPHKVFAFGNLSVQTNNSPRGHVSWWYHVAPAVSINGMIHVLDPSIEAKKPLPLKEWLRRMGTPEKIKIAICGSGTNFPRESCQKETDGHELNAERLQLKYLKLEEQRIRTLGRSPSRELGDYPPWSGDTNVSTLEESLLGKKGH